MGKTHRLLLFLLLLMLVEGSLGLSSTVNAENQLSATPFCKTPGGPSSSSSSSTGRYCYKRLCRCIGHTADCSKSRLTYIPRFNWSEEVSYVKFNDNNLTTIPDDFFYNVTHLRYLSLSYNQIKNISTIAFAVLKNLEALTMEHNFNLTDITLNPVFQVKTLRCVDLNHGTLTALPDALFRKDAMPRLEYLNVGFNYLKVANLPMFVHLHKLKVLDWSGNTAVVFRPGRLPTLTSISLFVNGLYNFPDTCDVDGTAFFPSLALLNLKKNRIHAVPRQVCLPMLEFLELSATDISVLYTDMFHNSKFPHLQFLYLESMNNYLSIERYAINNTSLKKISFMYNNLKFSDENKFNQDMLAGCPEITMLILSHNEFSGTSYERFIRLFGHLIKLERLFLGGTSVGQSMITPNTFAKFPRLKALQLYKNSVTDIPDGLFHGNPLLEELQLNDNSITVVQESAFNMTLLKHLRNLDLSGNPFSCDCELRWFSHWLRTNSTLFSRSRTTYNCSHDNVYVRNFHIVDQACLLDRRVSQLIIFSTTFILVLMTGVSTLYRYRWHLRLLLYEAFRGRGDVRRKRLQQVRFDYDIFVSYAHQDLQWVCQHLLPELEGHLGLRLCVHERDFLVGNNIADNIVNSVENSKKILMVFSDHFVQSQWCQFELSYCLRHVIDNDDALLIVCLGDVASRDITSAMMAVLKTTTYIQWVENNQDARMAFWGRLTSSLQEIAIP